VPLDQLSQNLYLTCEAILNLFGANFFGRVLNMGTAVILVHAAVMMLVIWGCLQSLRAFLEGRREPDG